MAARSVVSVFKSEDGSVGGTEAMPSVFLTPIRPDLVLRVHTGLAKNKRQAYAVSRMAGMQTAAESWGTGRAVSRIPRVPGGGTHRSGQGAFGNMCRGGRMFAPTKIWRKWHAKVGLKQRRHALASALAASALPALVTGHGHKIDQVPEVPLVVDNSIEELQKTAKAVTALKTFGAFDDVEKVKGSKKIRTGRGKIRNRRYVQRKGPLIVYGEDKGLVRAFRNLPGVELCNVDRLNLLQIAPGGHLGRFVIWTEDAFKKLDQLYGNPDDGSELKKGYKLPRNVMANSDIARIINSDEIQSVLRPVRKSQGRTVPRKKNPLRNKTEMLKLNPAIEKTRNVTKLQKKKADKQTKLVGRNFYQKMAALE